MYVWMRLKVYMSFYSAFFCEANVLYWKNSEIQNSHLTPLKPESQKAKTFRIARFFSQKLSGYTLLDHPDSFQIIQIHFLDYPDTFQIVLNFPVHPDTLHIIWIFCCKVSGNSSANNELVAKTFRICKNFPVSIADALTGFL